ncbi:MULTISPECIES: teichuronic acid biosynthesis protein TuaC [Bacillus]|uniref:Glycosyl transferase family 1 n=2 Tax=Bacillus TaxID=1386 RepID=A0A0M4GAG9_9BACI|nr:MULTISPECIES: glycosyltransferase [Bacillus]ALC82515.1 glycosyl transferase family 1 [Bacillus gobiensis]MBP1081417.1 teichuronic acid biosynthesis glycosyltransferase TuaC [Bacillus capparidis]MED1096089.1 glycosyltransferase [Bacillus capparidis]
MKVLWITSTYPSEQNPGTGIFHETQAQALKRLGIHVEIICPKPVNLPFIRGLKKQYKMNENVPAYEIRNGIPVHRPSYRAVPGQLKWAQPHKRIAGAVLRTMKNNSIKPDLIHAHFAMPSGGAAAIVSESASVPYVLTLHGSDVNVYPHYSRSAYQAFLLAVQSASMVFSVSEELKKKAEEMAGVSPVFLPIGVDFHRFQKPALDKMELRKAHALPADKVILTFVGRLVKDKGVYELAEAVKRLESNYFAVFIGDGPEKEALQSSLGEKAKFTGQIANSLVTEYLSLSDLFVLPSYREGMPTVVIEALALETPVLSTAVGGVPSLFGRHKDLLVSPQSADALLNAIVDFTEKDTYTPEIVKELHEQVRLEYDADRNAKFLADHYHNALTTFKKENQENLQSEEDSRITR